MEGLDPAPCIVGPARARCKLRTICAARVSLPAVRRAERREWEALEAAAQRDQSRCVRDKIPPLSQRRRAVCRATEIMTELQRTRMKHDAPVAALGVVGAKDIRHPSSSPLV